MIGRREFVMTEKSRRFQDVEVGGRYMTGYYIGSSAEISLFYVISIYPSESDLSQMIQLISPISPQLCSLMWPPTAQKMTHLVPSISFQRSLTLSHPSTQSKLKSLILTTSSKRIVTSRPLSLTMMITSLHMSTPLLSSQFFLCLFMIPFVFQVSQQR